MKPPSAVWCHPTLRPGPNNWWGWSMPLKPLSAQPRACPSVSVPMATSLPRSLLLKRKPPVRQ